MTIRTDKPEAEIGLFDGEQQLAYEVWPAHRTLAETLHQKIRDLLQGATLQSSDSPRTPSLKDLEGIVCFEGPGSFTGLRIGLSVGNALSYSLSVPIVATGSDDWVAIGLKRLKSGENDQLALPEYGSPVHTTEQKK